MFSSPAVTTPTGLAEPPLALMGHARAVMALAVLSNGDVVSGAIDGQVKLWRGSMPWNSQVERECLRTLREQHDAITAFTILTDRQLAVGAGQFINVHSLFADTYIRIMVPSSNILALAALPDGRLAAGCSDGIRIWELSDEPRTRATSSGGTITGPAYDWPVATLHLNTPINALAALSNGNLVAGCSDGRILLWDPLSATQKALSPKHGGAVKAVAILADGRLVSGSDDHTVKIWNLASGEYLTTLKDHTNEVYALAVLRDGRLASGAADGLIKIWDPDTGACLFTLLGHSDAVRALTVLPSGQLVSGSKDKSIKVWDSPELGLTLSTPPRKLAGHSEEPVHALVALSPERIASGVGYAIRVWDSAAGTWLFTLKGHSEIVRALAVLPNGNLASGSEDGVIKIWDTALRICRLTLKAHLSAVHVLKVLPNGSLVSASSDHTIKIWDAETGTCRLTLRGHTSGVHLLVVFPNGRLASVTDSAIKVWDPDSGSCLTTLQGLTFIKALIALPEGRLAFFLHRDLHIWDATSNANNCLFAVDTDNQMLVKLVLSAGRRLAHESYSIAYEILVGLPDGRLVSVKDQFINISTPAPSLTTPLIFPRTGVNRHPYSINVEDWKCPRPVPRALEFSSAPRMAEKALAAEVLTPLRENQSKVLDLRQLLSPYAPMTLIGHQTDVCSLLALADGNFVSAAQDGSLCLWSASTGTVHWRTTPTQHAVESLALLADGNIAAGSADHSIRILTAGTGECLQTLIGHTKSVVAMVGLSDGTLASASYDGTLRLWDPRTGRTLARTLPAHNTSLCSLIVLPNGILVAGAIPGGFYQWDLASGHVAAELESKGVSSPLTVLQDGRVAFAQGNTICLRRQRDVRLTDRVLKGHTGEVTALTVLSNGTLASAAKDGTIRFWNPLTGSACGVIAVGSSVDTLISPSAGVLVFGTKFGAIKVQPYLTDHQWSQLQQSLQDKHSVQEIMYGGMESALSEEQRQWLTRFLENNQKRAPSPTPSRPPSPATPAADRDSEKGSDDLSTAMPDIILKGGVMRKIATEIKDFVHEAGFVLTPHSHVDLSQGSFLRMSIEDGRSIMGAPPSLAEGWTLDDKLVHELTENFIGASYTSSTKRELNTALTVTLPVAVPVAAGLAAGASSAQEAYHFECQIKLNRLTKCSFYKPPADIKDRWNALAPDSPDRHFSHYIYYAAYGAHVTLHIEFSFHSKQSAEMVHAQLSGLPSIEAVISASQKIKKEGITLRVKAEKNGFVLTGFPTYNQSTNLVSHYNKVSSWAATATIETPSPLYFYAKPVSASEVHTLRPHNEIREQYSQVATRKYQSAMQQRVARMSEKSRLSPAAMAAAAVVTPEEDEIAFCNVKGEFLSIGARNKMGFTSSPANCTFKLVPVDGSPLLAANTENFLIQVLHGEKIAGYLMAQSAGLRGGYRLRLQRSGVSAEANGLYFQLQEVTGTVSNVASITADPSRQYYLVAPVVSSRPFLGALGYAPKSQSHFLTAGDARGCMFESDPSQALALSIQFKFTERGYLQELIPTPSPLTWYAQQGAGGVVESKGVAVDDHQNTGITPT